MRRVLPFVLLTVLIVPATASAQQGPPFPDAAREWLSRDLPFRFGAMIALGDSLFNNGSCTRCHGDDATGTRRAPNLTDAEWVQSEGDRGESSRRFSGVCAAGISPTRRGGSR